MVGNLQIVSIPSDIEYHIRLDAFYANEFLTTSSSSIHCFGYSGMFYFLVHLLIFFLDSNTMIDD